MAQPDPLDHTKWRLDPEKGKATIQFQEGRYGMKGCNQMSGPYKIEGNRIVAGQGISTMMACMPPQDQIDGILMALMEKNESFRIDGDALYLKSPGGEVRFTKEPLPSKQAVTKFIYIAPETKDCTGVAPMQCLQVRENPTDPWRLHYAGIVGFEHQPGIEYRLRIKEDKVAKPAADQSSIVWYLDLVVEQKVVDPQKARPVKP